MFHPTLKAIAKYGNQLSIIAIRNAKKDHTFIFLVLAQTMSVNVNSTIKQYSLKMCHLRRKLRIFLFLKKIMFLSRDNQVFVILAIQ